MAWTTPTLVEICIGLEINGYLPAEFWSAEGSAACLGLIRSARRSLASRRQGCAAGTT